MRVEFHILGPLEATLNGRRVDLGGTRQQTVLAVLLLDANRAVTVGRLMEAIYGDDPPTTSRAQIQICISTLRRLLASHGSPDMISTQSQAYSVQVPDDRLDSRRFENLVLRARHARKESDREGAVTHYREALSLWRGPALDGIESRFVQSAASRLDEHWISTTEDCIDLELDLARHHEVVAELAALTERHPLRERLRAQLMIALYRSGRQAEALQVYRRARQVMIDELGLEPNERLQQLEHAILTSDSSLDLPVQPVLLTPETPSAVPRLLPTDIADFTGRTKQIDDIRQRLTASVEDRSSFAVPIIVLVGKPGIGKSTIAVHVAHSVVEEYRDGQLFADLHGGASRPVGPMEVLERFLRALGVVGTAVPDGLEERAEMYRALLADRRMLIVLDDVGNEGQVLPLLPGSPASAVIVTSRSRLTGLAGAVHVNVDVFDSAQAMDLLARIAGADRVQSETGAATALARLCGRLPLALRIAGARLSARPHWSIGQLVERLEDETRRLDELKHGEMGIRASISLTYESVGEEARRLFRRLAVLESQVFSAWVGAALLERPLPEAQDLLDDLADAQLVEPTGTGQGVHTQYRFHDLIRVFARERLAIEEPAAERSAALARVLGGLLSLVDAARRREYDNRMLISSTTAVWSPPERLVDQLVAAPLDWFERERPILVSGIRQAAQAGFSEICWGLAIGAATFFESRVYLDDWRETQQIALSTARQAGDVRGQAAMLYSMGSLASTEQRFDNARRDFEAAVRLFEEIGDDQGVGMTIANVGYLDRMSGRLESAAARYEQALEILRRTGDQTTPIFVLHNLAQVRLECGDSGGAKRLLTEALHLVRGGVSRRTEAQVLHRMGHTCLQADEPVMAVEAFGQALEAVREIGDSTGETYILYGLGIARMRQGDLAEAGSSLRYALMLANASGERLAKGRTLAGLGELALSEESPAEAVGYLRQALSLFGTMSIPLDEAHALGMLSDAHAALGDAAEARTTLAEAFSVIDRIDPPAAQRLRVQLTDRVRERRPHPGPSPYTETGAP
ncbi:SARP family transcriptional regulator [Planomonospora parontospora subsp. parontospora]|uniref:SARP family transcriptional regulator n=2 Tax=Planomonospora parontospora TaxID=58119 RepID=A0AA37BNF5_9ACTN|nr:SARP family transcriptional regulator [Planomonospora parontospora]GII12837.1 SARP family transcriptional regulator [Planomonospora parontospora subsp. parontospora]